MYAKETVSLDLLLLVFLDKTNDRQKTHSPLCLSPLVGCVATRLRWPEIPLEEATTGFAFFISPLDFPLLKPPGSSLSRFLSTTVPTGILSLMMMVGGSWQRRNKITRMLCSNGMPGEEEVRVEAVLIEFRFPQ